MCYNYVKKTNELFNASCQQKPEIKLCITSTFCEYFVYYSLLKVIVSKSFNQFK